MNINSIKEFDGYIEDYLNFQFGDIQLHFITKYSPSFLKLSEENRLRIKSHFNKMLQFLETSLAQLSVPYLQSTFNHYLNKLASKIEQQYFLMFLFGNEKLISTYLNTFFIKLIKITNFSLNGVIDQIPDYYIESPEFTTFIELIGEWNCLNEFVILYLDLINKYYKNIFKYNSNTLSEHRFDSSDGALTANVLEFGVILLDGFVSSNAVDYSKIVSLVLSGVSIGSSIFCPELQLGALIVNQILGTARKLIKKGQDILKFKNYNQQVKKLNIKMKGLIKVCRNLLITLIKTEFSDWDHSETGLKIAEYNKNQIHFLCKTLNSFFEEKSIDKQIIINEFADFMHKNNLIESNDDWLVMMEVPEYLKKDT